LATAAPVLLGADSAANAAGRQATSSAGNRPDPGLARRV